MEKSTSQNKVVASPLSHLAILQVTGEDAADFLQAQFCNDVALIDVEPSASNLASAAQINGYCSPKGRLLAIFWIYRWKTLQHEEQDTNSAVYHLVMPADIASSVAKRLAMFVLRAKVVIQDVSANYALVALSGLPATAVSNSVTRSGSSGLISIEGESGQYLGLLETAGNLEHSENPIGVLSSWLDQSAIAVQEGSKNDWELMQIRSGIPEIVTETSDKLIPQMVNLQAVNGVSFKKGCYPGQEIVARMRYLGKLKRRMCRFSLQAEELPAAGAALVTGDDADAGVVIRAASAGDKTVTILAVVKIGIEPASLRLQDSLQSAFKLEQLPYSLESDAPA